MSSAEMQIALETASQAAASGVEDGLELLTQLIRCQTIEPRLCVDAAPMIIDAMVTAGLEAEQILVPDSAGNKLPVVIGWIGPKTQNPDVLLCAHSDTSPPGPGWLYEPFDAHREDGFIYGRGAAVSKSDIASFIVAASAAGKALDARKNKSIAVVVTSDEGAGGDCGTAYLLKELGIRPSLAIFPGVTNLATIAHNGCIQLAIHIRGAACHQSMLQPERDAMRQANAFCTAIYNLADKLSEKPCSISGIDGSTLHVTRVAGGTAFGMAPSEVEIWVDRRVTPEEDTNGALQEILDVLESVPAVVESNWFYEVIRVAEPTKPSDQQIPFVSCLQAQARKAFGMTMNTGGATLYTDARWYANSGIPTVLYGVGETDVRKSGANGSNERISECHFRKASTILARALVQYILERSTK